MSKPSSDKYINPYQLALASIRTDQAQWRAFNAKGNCAILAGPGSGKTKILTLKLAKLVGEEIRPPRRIACITYNNNCVKEIRNRVKQLGVSLSQDVLISTLHSFCLQHIIRPFHHLIDSHGQKLQVVSASDKSVIWSKAVHEILGQQVNPRDWQFTCELYRRTEIDRNSASWATRNPTAAKLIENYERIMQSQGLIDFDGMILVALDMVKSHDWICNALKSKFPIILIDEYQDLGVALHHLVKYLSSKVGIRIIAVGDADQSIYGFIGAVPELLAELSEDAAFSKHVLNTNYRSGQSILKASEFALGESRDYRPHNKFNGCIEFYRCPNGLDQQARKIFTEILPQALADNPQRVLGDFAIIYRTQYQGDVISRIATECEIEHIRFDQSGLYPKTPMTNWIEMCALWCSRDILSINPHISELTSVWNKYHDSCMSESIARNLKSRFSSFLFSHMNPDTRYSDWMNDLYASCILPALPYSKRLNDDIEEFTQMMNLSKDGGVFCDATILEVGCRTGSPNHLNLMTFHSAKGSEYEVVIMPGLEEGIIPDRRSNSPEKIQEERRLFYVGMTRAKTEVHLLSSGWYDSFGRKIQSGSSRFFEQVRTSIK